MAGHVFFAIVGAQWAICYFAAGGGCGLQASAAEGGGRGGGVDPWVVSADCKDDGVQVQD
jgi:hypothetical protein